jgi:hypothetical protein
MQIRPKTLLLILFVVKSFFLDLCLASSRLLFSNELYT